MSAKVSPFRYRYRLSLPSLAQFHLSYKVQDHPNSYLGSSHAQSQRTQIKNSNLRFARGHLYSIGAPRPGPASTRHPHFLSVWDEFIINSAVLTLSDDQDATLAYFRSITGHSSSESQPTILVLVVLDVFLGWFCGVLTVVPAGFSRFALQNRLYRTSMQSIPHQFVMAAW